ncbi:MAG: fatty acid desaturase [Acidimicrobiia bacterium]|nr:fatty acid desaturase [Acidimicrobiia bacterium]
MTPLETDPSSDSTLGADAPDAIRWREVLKPYTHATLRGGLFSLATSVVPLMVFWAAMYFALDVSYFLTLAIAVPAAGFLLRTYILFHDCAHSSLLPGRRSNALVGGALGVLVFTPFAKWRYEHTVHHATSGDLDRRFIGDVPTLTVAEYQAWPWVGRVGYRLFRSPAVMFGLGPIWAMLLDTRIPRPSHSRRIKRSVLMTDLGLLLVIGGLCLLIGWKTFVLVEAPFVFLAGGAGIWLFYVQHQFDGAYWKRSEEWNFEDAALLGSSYLKLPKILQFFTGNIGLHHAHHLSSRIPNYNLQRAHDGIPKLNSVPAMSFVEGLRVTRLKLYDEDAGRMVTWREVRQSRTGSALQAH